MKWIITMLQDAATRHRIAWLNHTSRKQESNGISHIGLADLSIDLGLLDFSSVTHYSILQFLLVLPTNEVNGSCRANEMWWRSGDDTKNTGELAAIAGWKCDSEAWLNAVNPCQKTFSVRRAWKATLKPELILKGQVKIHVSMIMASGAIVSPQSVLNNHARIHVSMKGYAGIHVSGIWESKADDTALACSLTQRLRKGDMWMTFSRESVKSWSPRPRDIIIPEKNASPRMKIS